MKPLWSGSVNLGLVNIPFKLYKATDSATSMFNQYDTETQTRISMRRFNAAGEEVPWERIVKGCEIDGKTILVTDEELRSLEPESTHVVDVKSTVHLSEIDFRYIDEIYYIGPDKSDKPYVLLRETLLSERKGLLGSIVIRNKEHPCIVYALAECLALMTLRYPANIRKPDFPIKEVELSGKELELAAELVERSADEFTVSSFTDVHQALLVEYVTSKAQGAPAPVVPERIIPRMDDLMAALEASIRTKKPI